MPEILLNGPIGRLEARYTHNNVPNSPSVLILHAHPGHGGNMNNNLPLKLHKFFSDIGFSSLRFNFRGHASGQLTLRDSADDSGTILFLAHFATEGLDIYVPGNGIRFETSVHATISGTGSVTLGYTG